MIIDELNELHQKGKLNAFVKMGIVSPKYVYYREIYLKFLQFVESGIPKTEAVTLMGERFGVSDQTIWTARRVMTRSI